MARDAPELAPDGPGCAIDEPPGRLGEGLRLPLWLEEPCAEIERLVAPLHLPHAR